jgi:hypothetical protein
MKFTGILDVLDRPSPFPSLREGGNRVEASLKDQSSKPFEKHPAFHAIYQTAAFQFASSYMAPF